MKKQAKKLFYCNLETEVDKSKKSNPRFFWKILKGFTSKPQILVPPLQYVDSYIPKTAYSDQEKAEVLRFTFLHFSSISSIDDSSVNLPEFLKKCENSLSEVFISENDVVDILSTLDIGKAVGPDKISHRMLKATATALSFPLALLFYRSIRECSFPVEWKKAHV